MTQKTTNGNDTRELRLDRYRRRVSMTTWTGAGFVGEIACVAAGALEGRPEFFTSAVITCCLLGGAFLAFARVQFEEEAVKIERSIKFDGKLKTEKITEEWPKRAENLWESSLHFILLGGFFMLCGIWFNGIIWISELVTQLMAKGPWTGISTPEGPYLIGC